MVQKNERSECNNELKVPLEAELVEAELATKRRNKLVLISVICEQKYLAFLCLSGKNLIFLT